MFWKEQKVRYLALVRFETQKDEIVISMNHNGITTRVTEDTIGKEKKSASSLKRGVRNSFAWKVVSFVFGFTKDRHGRKQRIKIPFSSD